MSNACFRKPFHNHFRLSLPKASEFSLPPLALRIHFCLVCLSMPPRKRRAARGAALFRHRRCRRRNAETRVGTGKTGANEIASEIAREIAAEAMSAQSARARAQGRPARRSAAEARRAAGAGKTVANESVDLKRINRPPRAFIPWNLVLAL